VAENELSNAKIELLECMFMIIKKEVFSDLPYKCHTVIWLPMTVAANRR